MKKINASLIFALAAFAASALIITCGRKGPEAPLTIVSTYPGITDNNDIPRNAAVSVIFSVPVDQASINFMLTEGTNEVSCAMSYSNTTAVFKPENLLSADTLYSATVRAGVRDLAGNVLAQDYLWYFKTGSTTTSPPADTHIISARAGPNGSISPSGSITVNDGEVQAFTVTADTGYLVASVTGCGGSLSGNTYTTERITADCSVTASFDTSAPTTYMIIASDGSGGRIDPSGTVTVGRGDDKIFVISPDRGYAIADVKVDGSSAGAVTKYTFYNVMSNHSISATFRTIEPATHTITASAERHGEITPEGKITVSHGDTKTFIIRPDRGHEVVTPVGGSCGGTLSGSDYTTNPVTHDCTIRVKFARVESSVTPSAGPNGSITPETPQQVGYQDTVSFLITPNPDYSIASVTGCGGTLAETVYTTAPVTEDCTVYAAFAENQLSATRSTEERQRYLSLYAGATRPDR